MTIEKYDLRENPGIKWKDREIDTIVGINVMEHIEDDHTAIQHLTSSLAPGGRLILLVPVHPSLYSTLDESLNHFRRYSKKEINTKLQKANLKIFKSFYINALGAVGWFVNGKIFPQKEISLKSTAYF